MEYLLTHDYTNNSVARAYEVMVDKYRETFPPETDEMFEPKTLDNAFIVLAKYAKRYQRDLEEYEVLYTEIAGNVTIREGRQMYFRMDSILKDRKTGKIISLEHKTGSHTWQWLEQWLLSIQFGTYTHVLMCLFPMETIDAVYVNGSFFSKGKKAWEELKVDGTTTMKTIPYDFIREPIKKSRDQMQVWIETVNYYYTGIKAEMSMLDISNESDEVLQAFPLNPTSCMDWGRICEYRDFCTAWRNPLRRVSDVPLGFQVSHWNPMEVEAKQRFEL